MILEIDYSGIEVRIAACYHKDPKMIQDITNPENDMHRDMAMACYLLEKDEVTKDTRYCGKNKFVFPQFYGDYYKNCATNLWSAIDVLKLKTKDGTPLKTHLKQQKIPCYLRFEKHIQDVEDYFWNERYQVYGSWRENHFKKYCTTGYITLKTGFICKGFMTRNEVINLPVQGSAFHCLLWSFIQLNKWMKKNCKKSFKIGQIHDSIVMDVNPSELNKIMIAARRIMTRELPRHWPWIIVPIDIEAEVTPVNGSWYLKKEIHQTKKCKCGNRWRYKITLEDDRKIFECPVCGNKEDR